MKVLMITTSYPDCEGSNRGIFIRRLCRELVGQGVHVVVLTPRIFRQSPLFEEEAGIKVYRFGYPGAGTPLNQLERVPVFSMGVYMLSGFLRALSLVIREKPDVIHGNWIVPTGLIASLAGLVTRTPVMNTARGMDVRVSEKGAPRFLFNLAVRLSDKVTVVSEAMSKDRKCLSQAETIPSGVDEVFFRIAPDRGSPNILHIRALERIYDAETLIRAVPLVVQEMPRARFVIAGTGSHASSLRELAHDLGVEDHIGFKGAVDHASIAELMRSASVYVSCARADGTSIALMEAIAAGLVPVVTDIGANRPLVTDGEDGFLFNPGDERDLADKILKAFSRGIPFEILDKKRSGFKDTVSWGSIAKRFIAGYDRLIVRSGR